MNKKILLFICAVLSLNAQTFDEFRDGEQKKFQTQKDSFLDYKKEQDKEFEIYKKAQAKAFEEYKKELGVYWEKPELSSVKNWLSYTKDKKTQTNVDFEKNNMVIKTIAPSQEEAVEKLKKRLFDTIAMDTKRAYEDDELQSKLSKVKKPLTLLSDNMDTKPIFSTLIFDKKPTDNELKRYVEKKVDDSKIDFTKSTKVKNENIYTLNLSMPDDAMAKRSKIYYDDVFELSKKSNMPLELIFAIMHTESSFNPFAVSPAPAYGLMQIVPKTAGIDTYFFLYKEKKIVSGEYLYNSKNNITFGSTYLHILYYKHFLEIKDLQSRLYCTIAAYNTGSKNVVFAFDKNGNIKEAIKIINSKSSQEVHAYLMENLKYAEARNYLKKVVPRIKFYSGLYN